MPLKGYAIQSIRLLGATPLNLPQLTERTVNPKSNVIYNSGSGQPFPSFASVPTVSPEASFTTTDLARIFGIVSPVSGMPIGTGKTYTGAELYYERKQDLGLREGALLHLKGATSKAILVPQALECTYGQEARLTMLLLMLSTDGVTAPLAYTDLVTPPTVYATEKFTIGPVMANGAQIPGVEGVTIDFAITVMAKGADGRPYPIFASIDTVATKITIRTPNVDILTTYGNAGVKLTSGAHVYFRKMQDGTIPYADADNQHVDFIVQANQGIIVPGSTSGQGSQDVSQELIMSPLVGSAGAILAVSSPSTIVIV